MFGVSSSSILETEPTKSNYRENHEDDKSKDADKEQIGSSTLISEKVKCLYIFYLFHNETNSGKLITFDAHCLRFSPCNKVPGEIELENSDTMAKIEVCDDRC